MAAVFVVVAGIAGIWAGVKCQVIYNSIVDSFPPQFQDELASRYAFPVYALSSPTPLPLQEDYVKALCAGCVAFLSISLAFFSSGNVVFGGFILLWFLWAVFLTIKSWKTYRENCDRAAARGLEGES